MDMSESELERYFELIGRRIPLKEIPPDAQTDVLADLAKEACAKRYHRRVWRHQSLSNYLDHQAQKSADFAVPRLSGLRTGMALHGRMQDFHFENPHGARFMALGRIHFRPPDRIPEDAKRWRCVTIENIELHPSLERQGFLKRFARVLGERGLQYLILQNVFNASFAYHLYQRSLDAGSHIVLLTPERADFNRRISPGPSFAWRL